MSALLAAFLGVIAVLLAAALYAAVVIGMRMMRDDGRLRLYDVVRGQGLPLPGSETEVVREGALAARRCVACAEHARCDQLLAARDWKALRAICPNTDYIDSLRAG